MAFDQATRNRLQKFVGDARKVLSEEFTQQLQNTYGLDPVTGGIAELSALPALSPSEQQTATLLRDTLEHYLAASHKADPHKEKKLVIAALDRIVREQSFTVLNRLAALRMAEARQFVMESISQGYQSKGFQLYQRIAGSSLGETGQSYQAYLFSVFDELSLDLAVLFDRYSSQGRLFPRETVLLELLDLINHAEIEILWSEDETVGWIYQYFNSKEERKKMRDESQAPRNSRELAVRNQFFTPRYVVEFLTDNTLGRIWYEMTQGKTTLVDSCQYLVRRPNEIFLKAGEQTPNQDEQDTAELSQADLLQQTVYIQHRPIKDPRDIKMLDPACGSMHFGLYAFDLFEQIYTESWDIEADKGTAIFFNEEGVLPKNGLHEAYSSKEVFLADVPRLIIEHNIHGVDIDPRAAQIAGLSLWLRAQKSWSENAINPNQRPQIQRSNIVCAEPMPGETQLLKEFTSQIQPRVLGQLVEEIFDKMQLAGEAGTLLKIEEEIQAAIEDAKSQKDEKVLEVQGNLFGDNEWEMREGKRYYNFGNVSEDFWGQAEELILSQLEKYAEAASDEVVGKKRLFAADTARGFAFIDLCRKKFDVVLMNPPFGGSVQSTKQYFKDEYPGWADNLYAAFLYRAKSIGPHGYTGAITSRTFITYRDFEKFRKDFFVLSNHIVAVADFGWGVLDDAQVETAAMIINNQSSSDNVIGPIFRLIDEGQSEKESRLKDCILLGSDESSVFHVDKGLLSGVPGTPFCYWSGSEFLRLINTTPAGYPEYFYAGLGASPHSFFFRLKWEVPKTGRFVPITRGGSYSPYYRNNYLMIDWFDDGSIVKAYICFKYPYLNGNYGWKIQDEGKYFARGITWGKRNERFNCQLMPEGHIFTDEGQGLIPEDDDHFFWLGYLNSSFVGYFLTLTSGLQKHYVYIRDIPAIQFSNEVKAFISDSTEKAYLIRKKHEKYDELAVEYEFPRLCEFKKVSDAEKVVRALIYEDAEIFNGLVNDIDEKILSYTGLSDSDKKEVGLYKKSLPSDGSTLRSLVDLKFGYKKKIFCEYVSHLFGLIFSRWGSTLEIKTPVSGLIGNIFDNDAVFNAIYGAEVKEYCIENNIDEVVALVGDFSEFLRNTRGFFDYHLNEYSQNRRSAPVYWPLQIKPLGYTLWVNFNTLNDQTLFSCVNNFIDPKLEQLAKSIKYFHENSEKSHRVEVEKNIALELEVELKNFREELLVISKIWRPDLSDGVQITAAPLWHLFQHKAWQKKLKKTWDELSAGGHGWSKVAYNLDPAGVLKQCSLNRSFAIAQGVEHDLWEIKSANSRSDKMDWQPKEMTEAELDLYIKNKIAQG